VEPEYGPEQYLDAAAMRVRLGVGSKRFRLLLKYGFLPPGIPRAVGNKTALHWLLKDAEYLQYLWSRGARPLLPDEERPKKSEKPKGD
jgi:hypothetical protein